MKYYEQTPKKMGGFLSVILKTVLVLLVLYALGRLSINRITIAKARKEVNELSSQADLAERTLDKLENEVASSPDSEALLEIAHESGYILPGERVFEDANGK